MLGSQDSSLRADLQANALQPQQPVVPASIPDQSPLRAQSTSETSVSDSERSSCYCTPFHGLWCAPAHGRLLSILHHFYHCTNSHTLSSTIEMGGHDTSFS